MTLVQNYEVIVPHIGHGKFSRVYKAIDINTLEEVSIKVIQKRDNKYLDLVKNEIAILSKLQHPNIIRYITNFEDKNYIYVVQELCVCDLRSIIFKDRNEQNVKDLMIQLREGLKYLYINKIFHRDLKPENILISHDGILKISDFGLSIEYQEYTQKFTQFCGTQLYMSPQILSFSEYNIGSDLWSLGVIFYELLYKFLPFGKPKNFKVLLQIIHNKKIIVTGISDNARTLLLGLLKMDSKRRIEWLDFFEHCWFKENIIKENSAIIDDNINNNINNHVHNKEYVHKTFEIIENYDKLESIEIKKLQNFQIIENYLHH